jgi:drug/metabolite transporter (DMT)-like permease
LLCLIWGSTWLAIKIGLEGSPPFLGAGFRFIISATFLFVLVMATGYRNVSFGGKLRHVLSAGALVFVINYGLVYWGSQYVESGMAAVLFATMPFFVALLARFYGLGERLTILKTMGMIIGFLGIILIFADNLGAKGMMGVLGMAAIVVSSAGAALGTVFSKKHFQNISPLFLTAVQSGIGAVALTAIGLSVEPVSSYKTDFKTIGSLLYLGMFGTALAFTLYFYILKRMEATKLATIAFITPVVAMILGAVYRKEVFDFLSLLGSLMVIVGVFIVVTGDGITRRRQDHARRQPIESVKSAVN